MATSGSPAGVFQSGSPSSVLPRAWALGGRRLGDDAVQVERMHLPSARAERAQPMVNSVYCQNRCLLSRSLFRSVNMKQEAKAPLDEPPDHQRESHTLWFNAPMAVADRRPPLTRERVVAEALTVIAEAGVGALTMRTLAARLGVVPGALYRHVRNKEQLQDLVLDGVLAEVNCNLNPSLAWSEQVTLLAHRLRAVLEDHPGAAGLLKTRDPLGPHSLAVAEAFLRPLQTAGFPHPKREIGLAFFLIIDYTTGFAV